jgi:hypothetical protein
VPNLASSSPSQGSLRALGSHPPPPTTTAALPAPTALTTPPALVLEPAVSKEMTAGEAADAVMKDLGKVRSAMR